MRLVARLAAFVGRGGVEEFTRMCGTWGTREYRMQDGSEEWKIGG